MKELVGFKKNQKYVIQSNLILEHLLMLFDIQNVRI